MHTRAHGRGRRASFAVVIVLAAACGSRVPAARPRTTPPPTAAPSTSASTASTTTVSAVTSTPAPSTTIAPSTTAAFDQAAATAQITANWVKFFTPGTSVDDRVALLQNGASLRAAIEQFATNPLQQQVSAKVVQVAFTSPTEATVTYDVSLNGTVALPAAQGTAVLEGGMWRVSQASFCSLLSLAATGPIQGCS